MMENLRNARAFKTEKLKAVEVLSLSIREPAVLDAIHELETAIKEKTGWGEPYEQLKRVARNQLVPKRPRGLFT